MNNAQSWTLIGVVASLATGWLAAVFTLHQSLRASLGDLRTEMRATSTDLRGSLGDLRDTMNARFDSVDRRLDGLDVQVLFRDRP